MTPKSWGILGLIIIILGGVAFTVFRHDTKAPAGPLVYSWEFSERGEKDGIPQTQVTLMAGGESFDIGTHEGSCAEMDSDFLEYEKSKVICWFAGGGHEIGVFEEPGQVVVRVGDVDEGASGNPGFRGNFTLVKTIR
ncbi:MAG: hypothetical protein JWL87_50 [Candidatus Adlerbacteria bacterium]|nr:hypothetical protein [Candidatus Adlerbacteria bacterium]